MSDQAKKNGLDKLLAQAHQNYFPSNNHNTSPTSARVNLVRVKLAQRGFSVAPLVDDKLLIQRWGLTRALPDVDAAEAFLQAVGGGA